MSYYLAPSELTNCLHLPTPILLVAPGLAEVGFANATASREWGYREDELQGMLLDDLVKCPSRREKEILFTLLSSSKDAEGRFEADVARHDGTTARHVFLGATFRNAGKRLVLLAGVDIAARHARELAFEADAHRLQALIDASLDAYYDWDISENRTDSAPQMEVILGASHEQLPSTLEEWAELVQPADRDHFLLVYTEAVKHGVSYDFEYRIRRGGGEYRLVVDRGIPLNNETGKATHLVGVVRDVTEERRASSGLRDSEELYRSLFATAANPSLRTDSRGRYVDANDAAILLLGRSKEELQRSNVSDHLGSRALDD